MLLSTSSFNDATACLKRFEYRHIEQLIPNPRRMRLPLRRGIWLHYAIEVYHLGLDWRKSLQQMTQWAVEHGMTGDEAVPLYEQCVDMMESYIDHWQNDRWEIIAHETPLTITTQRGHTVRATLDMVVKDKLGTWVVEHKSTTDIPPASWRTIDPQTMIQLIVARKAGMNPDGILFNYLNTAWPSPPRVKKNGEVYATDEKQLYPSRVFERMEASPPLKNLLRPKLVNDGAYFQRYHVIRPDGQMKSTARDVLDILERLEQCAERQYYPRSLNVMTCRRFCSYAELCVTEYCTGRPALGIRQTEFVHDTSELHAMGRDIDGLRS